MGNDLISFTNEEFGTVRGVVVDGEPWLVGRDVAKVLGYKDLRRAVYDHVDKEDKGVLKQPTLGGDQNMTIINESGFYSLVMRSKLPEAKKFRRWVTSEVLPSIRKHGAYLSDEAVRKFKEDPESIVRLSRAIVAEHEKRLAAESKVAELEPKAAAFDLAMTSRSTMSFSQAAAILELPYGNVTLVRKLRDMGVLKGDNTPVRDYIDNGYFTVKEKTIRTCDGVKIIKSTKVYQKGLAWLASEFKFKKQS